MIKKEGEKYCLYSKDGSKRLGEFKTMEQAKKREGQVEYFKKEKGEGGGGEEKEKKMKKWNERK